MSFQRSALSVQLSNERGQHALHLEGALGRPEKTAEPPAKIEVGLSQAG